MSTPRGPWTPLVAQADDLPEGPAKLALLEEAVRLADVHGDVVAGYRIRHDELFHTAYFAGRPEKVLVVFAWLLAQCDADPARFNVVSLCQEHYLDLLRILRDAVDIPRSQVEALLTDGFQRLHEPTPFTWRLFEQAAILQASFGDLERSAEFWARRNRLMPQPLGELAFSASVYEVVYHLMRREESAALAAGEPVFDWTRQGVQHHAFPWVSTYLLLPLWRAGRGDEARHWQRLAYPELRELVIRLGEVGQQIEFLVAVGNLDHAVRLFERHVGWLLVSTETIDLFHFHLAGWLAARHLRRCGPTARLRLPAGLPCHRTDGEYDVDTLAEYFGGVARGIAERYDARAGNDWFSRTHLEPVWALG